MITVIDSGIANIGSVISALRRIGAPAGVSVEAKVVRDAEALILPGVGAFADGMASLERHDLIEPIRTAASRGASILGICLGMQLLADSSEEFGEHAGLGLIPGRVVRLAPSGPGERVPNIGWCDVQPGGGARLFCDTAPGTAFYFVHSFHLCCSNPTDTAAVIRYGVLPVTVAVERGNVFGAQFHPEKSQDAGLSVLAAFADAI